MNVNTKYIKTTNFLLVLVRVRNENVKSKQNRMPASMNSTHVIVTVL